MAVETTLFQKQSGGAQASAVKPQVLQQEWLTPKEAAEYLRVKPRTILLWARQGKIKGYKLSGTARHAWRFRRSDLDDSLVLPSVHPERMVS